MGDNEGTSGSVVSEGGAASTEKQVKDSTTSAAAVVGQATEQPLANGTASEEGGSPNGGHNQPPTKAAVIKRIEFLFSKENLTSDVTLQYQMNHECYVPVVAVLNHPKITELTNNAELILEAIKSTSIVAFDGTQTSVKPTYTIPRTTIILREIPSTTTSEDITKLFGTHKPASVKKEIGDSWYVSFLTEDEMMEAFQFINKQKLNDVSIKARIKSESLAKSFYYPAAVYVDPQQSQQNYPNYNPYRYYQNYNPNYYNNNYKATDATRGGRGASATGSSNRYPGRGGAGARKGDYRKPPGENVAPTEEETTPNSNTANPNYKGTYNPNYPSNYSNSSQKSNPNNTNNSNSKNAGNATLPANATNQKDDGKKKNGGRRRTGSEKQSGSFQLGASHFPPLPTKNSIASGYLKPFNKYTTEDMVSLIKSIPEDGTKPSQLPNQEDCPAILSAPRSVNDIQLLNDYSAEDSHQPSTNNPTAIASAPKTPATPSTLWSQIVSKK